MGMIIEKTTYPGWEAYPAYLCRTNDDYQEVCEWMRHNDVKSFLLASGAVGYIFQVRTNRLLFDLRWSWHP